MYLGLHEGFEAIQSSKEKIEPKFFPFLCVLPSWFQIRIRNAD